MPPLARRRRWPRGLALALAPATAIAIAFAAAAMGLGPLASAPAAAQALRPPAWLQAPPASVGPIRPTWEALLFARLDAGDQAWLPRPQRLPDGRIRYVYRQRRGDRDLTLAQIHDLMRNPPRFTAERAAITSLLAQLGGLGVRVELTTPRVAAAAGEWVPREAVIRIRPDVPDRGTLDFAAVLNHEAIHVAQSCRAGGLRRPPIPLGLPVRLSVEARELLAQPLYARIPPRVRQLEQEAFSHQQDLALGAQLLRTLCRPDSGPGLAG